MSLPDARAEEAKMSPDEYFRYTGRTTIFFVQYIHFIGMSPGRSRIFVEVLPLVHVGLLALGMTALRSYPESMWDCWC